VGTKTIAIKDHPRQEEVELHWKPLWERKVQQNEKKEEWTRKENKGKLLLCFFFGSVPPRGGVLGEWNYGAMHS
jgi:hypothetical protein